MAARREAESEETVRLIKDAGLDAIFIQTDVSNAADVENLISMTIDKFSRLDFAFNNAGAVFDVRPLAEQEIENFDRAFAVNVRGIFLCMKYEIQQMLKQGQGVIVNNISTGGFRNFMHGQSIPLKHMGEPKEIAEAVLWLCSDAATFIVGHTLVADGGYLAAPGYTPESYAEV